MADLFLIYDTIAKRFIGASRGGHIFTDVAEVHLSSTRISVLDAKGRDILAPTNSKPDATSPERSKAEADIAAAFGFKCVDEADGPAGHSS